MAPTTVASRARNTIGVFGAWGGAEPAIAVTTLALFVRAARRTLREDAHVAQNLPRGAISIGNSRFTRQGLAEATWQTTQSSGTRNRACTGTWLALVRDRIATFGGTFEVLRARFTELRYTSPCFAPSRHAATGTVASTPKRCARSNNAYPGARTRIAARTARHLQPQRQPLATPHRPCPIARFARANAFCIATNALFTISTIASTIIGTQLPIAARSTRRVIGTNEAIAVAHAF